MSSDYTALEAYFMAPPPKVPNPPTISPKACAAVAVEGPKVPLTMVVPNWCSNIGADERPQQCAEGAAVQQEVLLPELQLPQPCELHP